MMNIYDIQGNVILSVPILRESEHAEELMRTDEVRMFWNAADNATLPDGAYVIVNDEKYSLLEPYTPTQRSENAWRYEPVFVSRFYGLSKVPFYMYTYEGADVDGTILSREADWVLTDNPANFMSTLCRAIKNETGDKYTYAIGADLAASATVTFNSVDIISALNAIANAFKTEFWLEKIASADASGNIGKIHLSIANNGETPKVLTVGENVNVPSITEGREGFYNRFVILGSTRNITQDYQGAGVNSIANKRLTLDPTEYPNGYIDFAGTRKPFTKILTFDEIYPSASDLVITNVRARVRYVLDDSGNRKKISTPDGEVDDLYTVWYFQLKRKVGNTYVDFNFDDTTYDPDDNPDGMMLPGMKLSIHFNTGPLSGREFELTYHKTGGTQQDKADTLPFTWLAGDYEINYVTEGTYIIPAQTGLVPQDDNYVVLFNIRMPDDYTEDAQLRLKTAAFKEIGEKYIKLNGESPVTDSAGNLVRVDMNSYQMSSKPVAFASSNPNLVIGSAVRYVNNDYTHETRVTALVTKLDFPIKQTITIGNERVVGTIRELQEQATNANQNIDLLAALNESTKQITDAYTRTQQMILSGMADDFFQENTTLSSLVELKSAYSYLGPRKGLIFDVNSETYEDGDTVPDLYVKTVDGKRVLYSPLPLITEGDQIVGGGTPGSGGGGGGAARLSELYDVEKNLSPNVGDLLVYASNVALNPDGLLGPGWTTIAQSQLVPDLSNYYTKSQTDSAISTAISALNLGAAATYGIGSVASGSTGLVTGGSVYSAINEAVSSILKVQGTTTTAISDGSTTNPVTINGLSYTAKKGDVVMYGNKEFWWTGSSWEELGDEASWALKTTEISVGEGLTGGGTLAQNRIIELSQETKDSLDLANSSLQPGDLAGYATQSWVTSQGYITGITATDIETALDYVPLGPDALNGYATQQWVNNKGYLPASAAASTYQPIISDLADIREGATLGSSAYQLPTSGIPKTDLAQAVQNSLALADSSIQAVYDMTLQVGGTTIGTFQSGEEDKTLTITAQNLYDAIGSTKYHPYGGSNSENTFVIGGATFTWHPASGTIPGYLELNSPFLTQGDQIVGSGTPGQGGGGGAGFLYELGDVYGTSQVLRADGSARQVGDVLQFLDNDKGWVAVAASSIGGVTSVAGNTGAVTAAQIATAIGLSNYLPLTGGTLTQPGAARPLRLNSTVSNASGLVFAYNNTEFSGIVSYTNEGYLRRTSGSWAAEYVIYDSGNFIAGINYVTPQTTLAGYGITDALRLKSLDSTDVLLSNKVWSAGTTNKGDFSAQTECPTPYGAYLSLQYDTSKNQGFQIYGDTTSGGNYGIYYRARFAGNAQTTYQSWRRVLDEANYSSYALPLAGGQINGTTASPLTINTTESANYLYFATGGTARGNIGYYSATVGMVFQCGDSYINIADGGELKKNNSYTFLHSGNYAEWINTTTFPGLTKTGTVTSVAMTVPTGLSVSGTPITASGTLAISLASGYSIPTTVKQSNWDTAYGWGNHASAGYLLATTAASTYVKKAGDTMSGNLTINGLSNGDNVAPLMINDAYASATWARFIQALYPNIPVGGIPNFYFGKAATARNGGVIAFYYAGSGSTSNLLTLGLHSVDHVLSVSGAGNVGIGYGTTPATYKLDVHKSGSSSGDVMRVSSEVSWANISYKATGTNRWAVGATQYGFGWWYEGLNDFAVFDTSGHLGIGTMTPHRDLDVVGVIQAGNASYNAVLEAQTDGAALSFWGYGSSAWHKGYIDASTLLINTRASGNVGIGTSSPSQKLHVAGVIRSKGSNGSGIDIGVDSNAIEGTTSSGYGDLYLQYFSTGKLVLCNGGGNVGIGITPSYKLHVNGTVGCGGLYCASTSSTAFAQVVNNTTMNWPISMAVMTPNLPVNGTHGFMVGRANSSGNTGIVSFRYVGAASAGNSVSLGFHTKDFIINAFYSGNVTIGTENTTDYGQKLYVAGNIQSTGDQIVSSDRTLKTNFKDVTYSVADIAKAPAVTFDWKDGRGRSAGSIAQYWKDILPELVHGEEGNMSLAYGQLALVNSILIAKHETEQDKEIARLKNRVAELEKQLRLN